MSKIIYTIFILSLCSCQAFDKRKGIEFKIINKSLVPLEKVIFTTTEQIVQSNYKTIKPDEVVSGFLSMKNNKTDGSYVLEFNRKSGKKEAKVIGYYTNGGPLHKSVEFQIENDSTIVNFD